MNKNKRPARVFVAPEFKARLFQEAKVDRGLTVIEYTRRLASKDKPLSESFETVEETINKKKKKKGFDFGFY